MKLRPAVFLDRDGVLNDVVERDGLPASPRTLEQLRVAADASAVHRLKAAGLLTFVITNQPDVARGHVSEAVLLEMLARIREDAPIDDYRVCVHEDAAACTCRKPRPGMLLDLARHWHVDLSRSFVIGDMWRDVGAARAAGCRAVLIRRHYNLDTDADAVVTSLAQAVDYILEQHAA